MFLEGFFLLLFLTNNQKKLKHLVQGNPLTSQKKIQHHLYGFLSIKKKFSTGQWLKLSSKKIKDIQYKNKIPILVFNLDTVKQF